MCTWLQINAVKHLHAPGLRTHPHKCAFMSYNSRLDAGAGLVSDSFKREREIYTWGFIRFHLIMNEIFIFIFCQKVKSWLWLNLFSFLNTSTCVSPQFSPYWQLTQVTDQNHIWAFAWICLPVRVWTYISYCVWWISILTFFLNSSSSVT